MYEGRYYAYVGLVFRNREIHKRFVSLKNELRLKKVEEGKDPKTTWEEVIKLLLDTYDKDREKIEGKKKVKKGA